MQLYLCSFFFFHTVPWLVLSTLTYAQSYDTGGDPYPGETPLQVALAVRDDGRVPTLPAGLSTELQTLMSSCWKFTPDGKSTLAHARTCTRCLHNYTYLLPVGLST